MCSSVWAWDDEVLPTPVSRERGSDMHMRQWITHHGSYSVSMRKHQRPTCGIETTNWNLASKQRILIAKQKLEFFAFIETIGFDNLNFYTTNAPDPFKSVSYERTKCSAHSCIGLLLWPHTSSSHCITFWGQIRAPGNLPNYVHKHDGIAVSRHLQFYKPRLFFLSNATDSFPSKEAFCSGLHFVQQVSSTTHTVKPHSICQAFLLVEVSPRRRASYKNFLPVYPARHQKQTNRWLIYITVRDPVAIKLTHIISNGARYITAKRD